MLEMTRHTNRARSRALKENDMVSPKPDNDQGGQQRRYAADPKWQRPPNLKAGITDPYIVLGLEVGVSQDEIRERYFALVREYPPEQDAETFKIVRGAYEKLRSELAQAETDLFLLQPPPPLQLQVELSRPDLELHTEDILTALRSWVEQDEPDIASDFREVKV